MANNNTNFNLDSNYNTASSFTRVKFGVNEPLLETELNEMQIIQDDARADLLRKLAYSGFYSLMTKGFSGEQFVYQPNNLTNAFAIAPAEINVNGYKVTVEGNTTIGGTNGYALVQLDPPPSDTSYRSDLVFLEVWFEEFGSSTNVTEYGYVDGNTIVPNPMIDPRVGDYTSHRVGIQWRIRIADGVDFDTYQEGMGVNSTSSYSPIYAYGANNTEVTNIDYVFMSASDPTYSNQDFYQDKGLYVAGRPTSTSINTDLGIFGDYVFGIPLFRVFRRNSQPYSPSTNPYGGDIWVNSQSISSRYDGLFSNVIAPRDVVDLRHTVLLADWNIDQVHNSALQDLITGNAQTSINEVMHRAQFGVDEFQPSINSDTVFYAPFNGNYDASVLVSNSGELTDVTGIQNGTGLSSVNYFQPSVNDFGFMFDGTFDIEYDNIPFNLNTGTIDFFFKPYWEGSDPTIAQTLLQITDNQKNPFGTLTKLSDKMSLVMYQTPYTNSPVNKIEFLFSDYPIDNDRFYHMRITWDINNNTANIYLDGQKVATGFYSQASVIPSVLIVGKNIVVPNPTDALSPQVNQFIQNSLLSVGTYYLTYTYVTSTGETMAAPEASVTLTVPYQGITFTIPYNIPSSVNQLNIYFGTTSNGETLLRSINGPFNPGTQESITSLPTKGMSALPLSNTASIPPDTLTPVGQGTIIDELIVYNDALIYSYQASSQVPLDFSEGLATIYPSFNGLMRDFADNMYEQSLLTMQYVPGSGSTSFSVKTPLPNATFASDSTKLRVYSLGTYQSVPGDSGVNSYTGVDSGKLYDGLWTGLGTDEITFNLSSGTFSGDPLQLQYALAVDGGHGLVDLPGEMLYATINTGAQEQEASFNLYNSQPRYVNLFEPTSVTVTANGATFVKTDYALDYSTSNHGTGDAFARVLYHYVLGNNTIMYQISDEYYGYPVLGIKGIKTYANGEIVNTSLVESITHVAATGTQSGYYNVAFKEAITSTTILEFEIALGGVTFDYNPYNKSVMSNIMKAETISYVAQGTGQELIFPVKVDPSGTGHGGCTVSYLSWPTEMDPSLVPAGYSPENLYTVYVNDVATAVEINVSQVGTPFIAITFLNNAQTNSLYIPPAGTKIDIPLLRTYQPDATQTLYVWYNQIPYQGTMTTETYSLRRVSEWKPFITTLSSGNTYLASENVNVITLPKNSIYNAINRLPGGSGNAYVIEGMPIIGQEISSGSNVNNQFVIYNEYNDLLNEEYNLDASQLTLTTDIKVSKVEGHYQDAKTALPFSLMGFVLPDTKNPIHKYAGASCLTVDLNTNELVLFVFGSLQNLEAQTESIAQAEFCDLFRIGGRPLVKLH